jgi:hypothetical protein
MHLISKVVEMGEATQEKVYFRCPNCSVELLWNSRVAGHKVSCPCGLVFVAPLRSAIASADAPPPEPEPERRAPRRDAELAALYMRPRKRVVDDEEEKAGTVRNVIVPSVLIVTGLAIDLTQVTWTEFQIGNRGLHLSFLQVMVIMLGMVVTTAGAVWVLTFLMNLDLGQLKPAAFKLISIPIFAGAIGLAAGRLDKDPPYMWGMRIGWSLMIICYWVGFYYFFKLELAEVMIICFVIALVQAVAMCGMFSSVQHGALGMPPSAPVCRIDHGGMMIRYF